MSWAARSCPDADVSAPAPRPLARAEIDALRTPPALPAPSGTRPQLRRMCEDGYWFCPRCNTKGRGGIIFKEESACVPPAPLDCPNCNGLMRWKEPVY